MEPRVALVTGCSSGLGRALCYRLQTQVELDGSKSYRVFATARSISKLQQLKDDGFDVVELDVSSDASVRKCVAKVVEAAGRIDMVINNAGVNLCGPLVEQPLQEIQRLYDTNVFGVLRVTQEVSPVMMKQRSGLIVNIGSVSADFATPFAGAYCSSKAALHSLSTTLRMELGPFDVRVLLVEAGAIRSSLSDNAAAQGDMDRYDSPSSAYQPLAGRIRDRAYMSQRDPHIMSAEDTARQVVDAMRRPGGPPFKARVAGNVTTYAFYGFLQSWLLPGYICRVLCRKFGLDMPLGGGIGSKSSK